MGSTYFYMEFLIAWMTLLQKVGYQNPVVLSVEYSLVPDQHYPRQLFEARAAYDYAIDLTSNDPSLICVAGDSAGATIVLSLLLDLSRGTKNAKNMPAYCVMISPWPTLISLKNRNTDSDYLDANSLHKYARQYLQDVRLEADPLASPGCCKDPSKWMHASPSQGWLFMYGSEEVLAPETEDLIYLLLAAGEHVTVNEEYGDIHAWPVAALFLAESRHERLKLLAKIVNTTRKRMGVKC